MLPSKLASVCLPIPVRTAFTYAIPEALRERMAPGRRVRVPFGPRTMAGWCVGFAEPPEPDADGKLPELKEVEAVLDDGPLLGTELLSLSRWIADTYACSWGEALSACVPGSVRSETAEATVLHATLAVSRKKAEAVIEELAERYPKRCSVLRILLDCPEGLAVRDIVRAAKCSDSPVKTLEKHGLITVTHRALVTDPFNGASPEPRVKLTLTPEQATAVEAVDEALTAERHETFLLYGVTSSGKTEVYLRAIRRCLESDRQAIVLVPEISLTPQTVARFRGWFDRVAVLHSALTDAERRRQWHRIRNGEADVVIGPRSAVFAPVRRLGLVVVDEEHETSFKQQSAPRYHARDVARERAHGAGAVVVLGSATPSLESWEAARSGRFRLLELPRRVGAGRLPRVEVVDMAREARETRKHHLLSRRLVELLERAFSRREQAILFLNRRGYATSVHCTRCGYTLLCRRCSVTVTYHRNHHTVLCHPCGEERPVPLDCPECQAPGLSRVGAGTERLEVSMQRIFPSIRLARMDSDSMHDRESYERVLGDFGAGRLDVLVGTQMIAKGLHFPRVTVVGVVSADGSLGIPDFRAAERTFQLVAQVAGRAGRSREPGHVVVQTRQPHHPAITDAARHDFDGFADRELDARRRFGWPPWSRLVRVVVSGKREIDARERATQVADTLRAVLPPGAAQVLGPAECPVARIRDRYRWQLLVKAADEPVQRAAVLRLARFSHRAHRTELVIDVDPVDMG